MFMDYKTADEMRSFYKSNKNTVSARDPFINSDIRLQNISRLMPNFHKNTSGPFKILIGQPFF